MVGISTSTAPTKGKFSGPVVTCWLDDGRTMRLIEGVTYTDSVGHDWPVPKGAVVDGASIPRFFWRVIGGPLEGPYRKASVIHDFYCEVQSRPWRATHRMFYDAMLTEGCGWLRATVMYWAVRLFGPKWHTAADRGI